MATHTTYYNLTKPAQNDKVNVGVLNDNADIIDTALHNKVDSDDLTADNVMMSDGVTSVEDACAPRTASGTTIAQLVSAIGQLSEMQKSNCAIDVKSTGGNTRPILRRARYATAGTAIEIYTSIVVAPDTTTPSNNIVEEFRFDAIASTYSVYVCKPSSATITPLTISEWTLYYQGTPIS